MAPAYIKYSTGCYYKSLSFDGSEQQLFECRAPTEHFSRGLLYIISSISGS